MKNDSRIADDVVKATRQEWIGLAVLAVPCLLYSGLQQNLWVVSGSGS